MFALNGVDNSTPVSMVSDHFLVPFIPENSIEVGYLRQDRFPRASYRFENQQLEKLYDIFKILTNSIAPKTG